MKGFIDAESDTQSISITSIASKDKVKGNGLSTIPAERKPELRADASIKDVSSRSLLKIRSTEKRTSLIKTHGKTYFESAGIRYSSMKNVGKSSPDYKSSLIVHIREGEVLVIDSRDVESTVSKEKLRLYRNKRFSKVILSEKISKIGRAAFSGMKIETVEFTSNMRMIDNSAFEHCLCLRSIKCVSGNPEVFVGDYAVGRGVRLEGFRPVYK